MDNKKLYKKIDEFIKKYPVDKKETEFLRKSLIKSFGQRYNTHNLDEAAFLEVAKWERECYLDMVDKTYEDIKARDREFNEFLKCAGVIAIFCLILAVASCWYSH